MLALRVGARRYLRSVPNFAVTLLHASNWDRNRPIREQTGWSEHAAFMDGLVDDGFIVVGGPLGDGGRTLHLIDAVDEQAVRRRLRSDPWAEMGLLEVGSIAEWSLWLDGRSAARSPIADRSRMVHRRLSSHGYQIGGNRSVHCGCGR